MNMTMFLCLCIALELFFHGLPMLGIFFSVLAWTCRTTH